MKHTRVDCGFIQLTDSAVLVAALEMGFAAEERVDLVLCREGNWSSIRDKIALGTYPVAHMLSPMAVAMSLGLGPMPIQVDAPFVLNLNGNTLSAALDVAAAVRDAGGVAGDPVRIASGLAAVAEGRPLRIGVPFPQSMHRTLVRYFLDSACVDPAQVVFTVAPPPVLPDVLKAGEVDLTVVGEPWGSMAVERGDAEILLPLAAIWAKAPEKVLGVRRDWAEDQPDLLRRLIRALYRAAGWCATPGAASTLAEILAMPRYLGTPVDVIERALVGELVVRPDGALLKDQRSLILGGGQANFPWRSAGMRIGAHAAPDWGVARQVATQAAADCFRTDLFRQALSPIGVTPPADSVRTEDAFFDAQVFDFSD